VKRTLVLTFGIVMGAAMIAWAGAMRLSRGLSDDLAAPVRARWPLDPDAPPALGAGVKA